ncbi:MAG: cell wall-binding repeat-containing protein [Bacillota bacterium]|nr:cell wall-binding repeat-containing protein [Bacillota bacterium]
MLRRVKNKIVSLLVFSLFFSQSAFTVTAFANTNQLPQKQYTSKRIGGQNRIDTSIQIANEFNNGTVQNIILATADDFPDALSGSVLSKKYNAPILLVGKSETENASVFDFIKKHLDANGSVYILGGIGAVSDDVVNSIKTLGFKNFVRLGGADRLATNLKIQGNFDAVDGSPIVIATENDFPDALSISSVAASKGYPILLSDKDSLSQDTIDYINTIKPSTIYIIGGTGVISTQVENKLSSLSSNVKRISGNDRFETSLAISKYFDLDTSSAVIATGLDFPDALSGSSLASKNNAPILLVNSADISKEKSQLDSTNINNLYILGGNGAVSDDAVSNLVKQPDKAEVQNLTGYIIDVHCFLAKPNPASDTKGCLSMKSCADSGYGVAVLRSDGTYKFYFLDGELPDNATGGQLQAVNLISNTTKKSGISVNVSGILNGTTKVYTDSNGVSHTYPVLTVSSLAETSNLKSIAITTPAAKLTYSIGDKLDLSGIQVTGTYDDNTTAVQAIDETDITGFDTSKAADSETVTININGKTASFNIKVDNKVNNLVGYIIDQDCFSPTSNIAAHSKGCLQMTSCAASGYGIAVQQNDDKYKFYFFDGAFAPSATGTQVKAADLIDKSTKSSHISIAVSGTLSADTKTVDGVTYPIITASSLAEAAEPAPVVINAPQDYIGWLADSQTAKTVTDPTKIDKSSLVDNDYGVLIVNSDNSTKFIKFDAAGQKLINDDILSKTTKTSDIRIRVNGVLNPNTNLLKTSTAQEETELLGIVLTKSTFDAASDPAAVKRDDIVKADSVASGYGLAVKQSDGKYKFYKFDDNGNKSAKSLVQWYVNWSDNISSIPGLAQGIVDNTNNTIVADRVLRARLIPGQLASVAVYNQDKALKDITKADLLTPESIASGYGYYVHSCGGHEFFPFDTDSNTLVENFIKNAKSTGKIDLTFTGFYYWVGRTIKVNTISEDTAAETAEPVTEQLSGVIATRNYFKGSEYASLGAPGTITKDFLLNPDNASTGYGIIYHTCCRYGYLRLDDNGTKLIKNIISNSKLTSNINVIITGKRDEDTIYVTSAIEANEQTYSGTLAKTDTDGYGLNVKQSDGTSKFYKFDDIGSYYHDGGQTQAKDLLTDLKKDTTTVDVKGTIDGDTLIVTSIKEDLTIPSNPVVQTFTGFIQDEDCFISYAPDYGSDTKSCLLMKSCAASGYGITALQSDGTYKFYYFDGDFATLSKGVLTPGTGSQLTARNLISNTTKADHVTVKVTGTLSGQTKTADDGNVYPVITVTSLEEN